MYYHNYSKIFKYSHNNSSKTITSLSKHNQGYKNTYLYKQLHLEVHHKNIKNYHNINYKLKVYGIETIEELNEVMKYDVTIIEIKFEECFNAYVDENNLPHMLQSIVFGWKFNHTVDNLPRSLKYVKFGHHFNKNVDKLPQSLYFIEFGENFNQNVDNLPRTLKFIKFNFNFNQKVDKLPQTLKYIEFGMYFNQSVDNLPHSLISIKFGEYFNQKVDKLPQTLKYVYLHKNIDINNFNIPSNVLVNPERTQSTDFSGFFIIIFMICYIMLILKSYY